MRETTPSNKEKKYEEVPLSEAENLKKRIDLVKRGAKISTNIKNNDNTSANYRGSRKRIMKSVLNSNSNTATSNKTKSSRIKKIIKKNNDNQNGS